MQCIADRLACIHAPKIVRPLHLANHTPRSREQVTTSATPQRQCARNVSIERSAIQHTQSVPTMPQSCYMRQRNEDILDRTQFQQIGRYCFFVKKRARSGLPGPSVCEM